MQLHTGILLTRALIGMKRRQDYIVARGEIISSEMLSLSVRTELWEECCVLMNLWALVKSEHYIKIRLDVWCCYLLHHRNYNMGSIQNHEMLDTISHIKWHDVLSDKVTFKVINSCSRLSLHISLTFPKLRVFNFSFSTPVDIFDSLKTLNFL